MPSPKLSHVVLVVSDIERSLPFYRELLEPIGWTGVSEVRGERGDTIWCLSVPGPGIAVLGLRQKQSDAHPLPYDRYAVGIHHVCFDVASRELVDERAHWLAEQDATIESGPREYDYTPGYYAASSTIPTGSSWSCCTDLPTGVASVPSPTSAWRTRRCRRS